jgi:hypothetical protein
LTNKFYLPNIGYLDLGAPLNWAVELGAAANSKRLWLHSLVFVHALLLMGRKETKDKRYVTHAVFILKSYFSDFEVDNRSNELSWGDEHAVANRLFVLCAVLFESIAHRDIDLPDSWLIYLIEQHAEWLLDDSHYVKNNHGLMMDVALVQASLLLYDLDNKICSEWISVSVARLEEMLDQTFDSSGCCNENSPAYHFVNYSLFSSVVMFFDDYNIPYNKLKWISVLGLAREVGQILIRSDGTIPLIGDSEEQIGTFFPVAPEPRYGVACYPDSGLFVANLKDCYFTLRCGGSSFSHRHIDDSSVTLWLDGRDFIVDAGLYNYDISDKMRRWLLSSRSHSGFYIDSASDVRFVDFDGPSALGRIYGFERSDDGVFVVRCAHYLSAECAVNRTIEYLGGAIAIQDSFKSRVAVKWRQQFLFHPECVICVSSDGKEAEIAHGKSAVRLRLASDGHDFKIGKGYYSRRFMHIEDAPMIFVAGEGSECSISTEILLHGSI